jgi:multidrug transporter EmrE-like cation transporter
VNLLLSLLAAGAYTVGGVFMRKSEGFAHALPAAAMFACFCAGASLQTLAVRHSEVSVNYPLVVGLEALLAVLLGAAWLGEAVSAPKLAGLALILAGVTCLSLQEKRAPPEPVVAMVSSRVARSSCSRSAAANDIAWGSGGSRARTSSRGT